MRWAWLVLLGSIVFATALLLRSPVRPTAFEPSPTEDSEEPARPVAPPSGETLEGPRSSPATESAPVREAVPTTWIEVSGRVVRYRMPGLPRDPISGAQVRVRLLNEGGGKKEVGSIQSDENGNFAIRAEGEGNPLPLRLEVVAEKQGFLSWPGSGFSFSMGPLPFSRQGLELALYAPWELGVRVLEPYGEIPVAGALVESQDEVWKKGGKPIGPVPGSSAVTDARGRCSIPVPEGVFVYIGASASGYLPVLGLFNPNQPPEDGELVLRMPRADQFPRIAGQVTDAEGRPIEGATVRLGEHPGAGPEMDPALSAAYLAHRGYAQQVGRELERKTDREGRYSFQLDYAGGWEIAALAGPLLEERWISAFEPKEYVCDFRMAEQSVVLVGVVRSKATGEPVPKAEVAAYARWVYWNGANTFSTDSNGEFRCGPVPREPVTFTVQAPRHAPTHIRVEPVPGSEETRFTVELAEEGRLRGRLLDDRGDPVPAAPLTAFFPPGQVLSRAQSREDGSFAIGSLPIGAKFVLMAFSGEAKVEVVLERPGEDRDLGAIVVRGAPRRP